MGFHRAGSGPELRSRVGSTGPSKRAQSQLFISESGLDDDKVWVVAETIEVGTQAGNQIGEECQEMVAALWAHNASIWLQVDAQEWMGASVEHLVQAMDLQRDTQEVLASALLHLSSHIGAQLGPEEEEWGGLGGVGQTRRNWGRRIRWGSRGVGRGRREYSIVKDYIIYFVNVLLMEPVKGQSLVVSRLPSQARETRGTPDSDPVKGTQLGRIRQVEI